MLFGKYISAHGAIMVSKLLCVLILSFLIATPVYADNWNTQAIQDTLSRTLAEALEGERHHHRYHSTIAAHQNPTGAVKADTREQAFYTFDLTAAADSTFGTDVQVLGTGDTPIRTGMNFFEFAEGFMVAVNSNTVYKLRIACGASYSDAVSNGDYTDIWIRGDSSNPQQSSPIEFEIGSERFPAGSLVWIAIANAAGAQTASFLFAIHEYPE